MVVEDKINNYDKYFRSFELHWIPAIKHTSGRPSEGFLCGIKRMNSAKLKVNLLRRSELIIVELEVQSVKYYIIPIYLNFSKWDNDFLKMQNFLIQFNKENIILMGDFNARIGNQQDLEPNMSDHYCLLETGRNSKDVKLDGRGIQFLDFCNENGLVVLNGRINGDADGEYTYISKTGCSVIDLCCASGEWIKHIKDFKVIEKQYTKHMPIILTINFGGIGTRGREINLLPRLYWNESRREKYVRNLDLLALNINENAENIESLNNKLIDTIKIAAGVPCVNKKLLIKK